MFFLDIDESCKDWYYYRRKHANSRTCQDLVELEAKRMMNLCPKLGDTALIYRSSNNGWHIIYPKARLTWKEVETLLSLARCHNGYKYFSLLVKDQTVRVSPKYKSKIHAPYLSKIVRRNDHA